MILINKFLFLVSTTEKDSKAIDISTTAFFKLNMSKASNEVVDGKHSDCDEYRALLFSWLQEEFNERDNILHEMFGVILNSVMKCACGG